MKKAPSTLAVFDLDGTLTTKDTYLEFLKYAKGSFRYYLGLFSLAPSIILFYLKLLSNYRLKEKFFTHYFKDHRLSDIQKLGAAYSEEELPKLIRDGAKEVLQWHENKAHSILILSASADIWLKQWCHIRGYDLICTKFESKDGVLTGKLDGKNCYGEEKKHLLSAYLESYDFSITYGYGDSSADMHFLNLVDKPYLMELTSSNVKKQWQPL